MTDTPLDLDVIEAHHRRTWRGDDMVPTCSCGAGVTPCTTARLVAALRKAEAKVAAVLLWGGAVSVVLIVGGCWLAWRAWFA